MAIDTSVPRTRRALLTGGIGGLAALLASALGRPLPAAAGSDGDVVLGAANLTSATTLLRNGTTTYPPLKGSASKADGVMGESDAASHAGVRGLGTSHDAYGVFGSNEATLTAGCLGGSDVGAAGSAFDGYGVWGDSSSGIGVYGKSSFGSAILGLSGASDRAASVGHAERDGAGLFGFSGGMSDPLPAIAAKTGVYGRATQDATSSGVRGLSTVGRGVYGQATSGQGVRGSATSGTGGFFAATSGYALRTSGRLKAEQVSGIATIPKGTAAKDVILGVNVTASSFVLLTPRGNLGGRSLWCTLDTTNDRVTIRASSAVPADLPVGWLLLG
jgi:hypothetical protein